LSFGIQNLYQRWVYPPFVWLIVHFNTDVFTFSQILWNFFGHLQMTAQKFHWKDLLSHLINSLVLIKHKISKKKVWTISFLHTWGNELLTPIAQVTWQAVTNKLRVGQTLTLPFVQTRTGWTRLNFNKVVLVAWDVPFDLTFWQMNSPDWERLRPCLKLDFFLANFEFSYASIKTLKIDKQNFVILTRRYAIFKMVLGENA